MYVSSQHKAIFICSIHAMSAASIYAVLEADSHVMLAVLAARIHAVMAANIYAVLTADSRVMLAPGVIQCWRLEVMQIW